MAGWGRGRTNLAGRIRGGKPVVGRDERAVELISQRHIQAVDHADPISQGERASHVTSRRSDEPLRECQRLVEGVARRPPNAQSGAPPPGAGGKNHRGRMRGGGHLLLGDRVEDPTRSRLVEHRVDKGAGVKHDQWPNSSRTSVSRSVVSITV